MVSTIRTQPLTASTASERRLGLCGWAGNQQHNSEGMQPADIGTMTRRCEHTYVQNNPGTVRVGAVIADNPPQQQFAQLHSCAEGGLAQLPMVWMSMRDGCSATWQEASSKALTTQAPTCMAKHSPHAGLAGWPDGIARTHCTGWQATTCAFCQTAVGCCCQCALWLLRPSTCHSLP